MNAKEILKQHELEIQQVISNINKKLEETGKNDLETIDKLLLEQAKEMNKEVPDYYADDIKQGLLKNTFYFLAMEYFKDDPEMRVIARENYMSMQEFLYFRM